jgi:uncharacterized membrane protein (DUF2068 family)
MTRTDSSLVSWIVAMKVIKAATLAALGAFLLDYLPRGPVNAVVTLANAAHVPATSAVFERAVLFAMDTTIEKQALLAVTALAYAVVFSIEAVGLWRRRGWARWFTIGVTASLLPFEVYEIIRRPHEPLRIATLVVNILVVLYLYRRKEAFH